MQIPQNIIDEIISRADIVDVLGKSLKLKRQGANYFACCPFHKEKSASFSVSSVKQMYYCFGCGESGDALSFIMKYNGWEFIDSVKYLANQYGVTIPDDGPKLSPQQVKQQKERKLGLAESINKVVLFYRKQLASTSFAQNYLNKRGLSADIINSFNIGYSPDDFNALEDVFNDYKLNPYLKTAGLVIENEESKRTYDRFRNRIMFPIRNIKGDVIGFGGRVIDKGEPKYLNSPETELFNKSHELYGLFEANKSIRSKNFVIVVEGYMDVIALFQYGFENAVATMGTSISVEHIKRLFRSCDDIYYCFDGDAAGKKAAWRALERSIPLVTDNKAVHFLFLPSEHDPDSFIRERGVAEFELEIKKRSLSLSNFLLKELSNEANIASDEGKARLISLAKPYLEQVNAVALHVMLKKQLAEIVELDPSTLESVLNNRSRYAFYNNKFKQGGFGSHVPNKPSANLPRINIIQRIVKSIMRNPALVRLFPILSEDELSKHVDAVNSLFDFISYIDANYDNFSDINIVELTNNFEFTGLNLYDIHKQIVNEMENFTSSPLLTDEEYITLLQKLLKDKKYLRK